MVDKVLVLLQENTGLVPLPPGLSSETENTIYAVIDTVVESLEDWKTSAQAAGAYDRIYHLTDHLCTRSQLVGHLIGESQKSNIIDLVILGHGSNNSINLYEPPDLRGRPSYAGNVHTIAAEAEDRGVAQLSLRMVYSCSCYGGTLNDDWLAVGAQAAVGSVRNDYMPEPMTSFFMHKWLSGKPVKQAADEAYEETIPFFVGIYPPTSEIKYKNKTVTYSCPTFTNPGRTCERVVRVPDGVRLVTNDKIKQTRLVTQGNPSLTF